ncbi:methylase involved in ubiquinone/menaquinone biosynthesis [Halobacteroides halobius DSM 5150]|uniref:Arsenite methyltransferase n=1 Tax=Halobacteroides halobius (strain ATCC 35273 / DSM 5150 / MD-1) TaxID=748449 RepID=L0KBF1_HALHC|nr:arsenite methyltransferase [Halobacteroides halobius]AGB41413.1 methylase involved in ubiquinone/menaquinone biosynthesis [Halobacteroides halobius DSM 5150]
MVDSKDEIREEIMKNYSQVAKGENTGCCNSGGCCSENSDNLDVIKVGEKLGYFKEDLESDFIEANQGLGCGNPKAIANLNQGQTVLDLGCGAGFDVFLAAREVGSKGRVIGVDMTPEMINKARKNAKKNDFTHVDFRLGEIEHLPVADNSVDVVISNCVINLSVDKEAVFNEISRVLKPGGTLAISDVLRKDEFPEEVKNNIGNYSSCIAGALSLEKLRKILEKTDLENIKIIKKDNSKEIVKDWSSEINTESFIFSAYITAQKPQ